MGSSKNTCSTTAKKLSCDFELEHELYYKGMEFVKPRALKKGDVVGIFAPSDYLTKFRFFKGVKLIESWGLKVKYGKHLFERVEDFMAGSTKHRAEDLKKLIYDKRVVVLWAADGGYAATNIRYILGRAEMNHLRTHPKWLVGYSDVGVLTNAFFANGLMSVMGPNVWGLTTWNKKSTEWLRKLLFGEISYFPETGETLINGEAEGRLLASNLDSLAVSLGTKYDPILHGEDNLILLIEDWKVGLSTLVRQIEAIFDHSRFDRVKGLILGRFSLITEASYPKWAKKSDLYGLIKEKLLLRKKIPLVSIDFAGHPNYWHQSRGLGKDTSLAMPNGIRVKLSASGMAKISCLESICA